MSAATDKARFFLEKSVPELKEYERKKIFTKVCRKAEFFHQIDS
jgi:U3 small nucleolar RNA-associated protein 6